jgi:dTDP-4-amino-4,6-dideoxygalactose transaminase
MVSLTQAELMRQLRYDGVGIQVNYYPVHRQPYYENRYGVLNLEGANAYYARCLSLPFYPALSYTDQDFVIAKVLEIV